MPHLILECSQNINVKTNFEAFFQSAHAYLENNLSTDISNCKSRVISYEKFLVGAGVNSCPQAFVHLTLKIRPGRTSEVKTQVGHDVYLILKDYINHLNLDCEAVSVELIELSDCYFK